MPLENCATMDLLKKYRPRRLADKFEGLDSPVNRFLAKAITAGRLPRLLAITGPAGTGKGTTARILGRRHVCQNQDAHAYDACLECDACRSLDGTAASVLWSEYGYTEFDATSMDGARILEHMVSESHYRGSSGRPHLFVIDELARSRTAIQERLLRFTENTKCSVILTTIDPGAILEPLLARFTHLALRPPTPSQIVRGLIRIAEGDGYTLTPDAAGAIARAKSNNPRECVGTLSAAMVVAESNVVEEQTVISTLDIQGMHNLEDEM